MIDKSILSKFGKRAQILVISLFLTGPGLAADLSLAKIFADHGVLQQNSPVPIWGQAKANTNVAVEFAGQRKTTTSDQNGAWKVTLDFLKANAIGTKLTVSSSGEKIEIKDLLVGEVWYASGQSNMQMTLASCAKKIPAIATLVADPKSLSVRTLRLGNPDTPNPLTDLPQAVTWQLDTLQNRPRQSAVAYFFAHKLHTELKVPIGIIEGSWGGKPIEGFIPRDQFKKRPKLAPILHLSDAEEFEKLKQLEGGVIVRNTAGRPARIYNSRIHPIAPYAINGFIWYQGESNAGVGEDPRNYRFKTEALVQGWRSAWQQPELPFYFVQLPSFNDTAVGWVRLREEQRLSLSIPHTGMAVAIDLHDQDIHPSNKLDVGKRLAVWALAQTYQKPIPFSGPLFRSASIEGNQIRVHFDHAAEGLMAAQKTGLDSPVKSKSSALAHFEIADASGKWHPADANIDGQTVIVKNPTIANPTAVRYACQGAPLKANLYNAASLPASPFCSKLELLPWAEAK